MAELGDVIGGDIITAAFTNDVKNRTVMKYASAAARDASIPTPVEGDLAFLADQNVVTYYAGSSWHTLVTSDGTVPITGTLFVDDLEISQGIDLDETLRIDVDANASGQTIFNASSANYLSSSDSQFTRFRSWSGSVYTDIMDVTKAAIKTLRLHLFQLGGYVETYNPDPPVGTSIYTYQVRNVIVSDTGPPSDSNGIDGDICHEYRFAGSAQNEGCLTWVKVDGAWRGMS